MKFKKYIFNLLIILNYLFILIIILFFTKHNNSQKIYFSLKYSNINISDLFKIYPSFKYKTNCPTTTCKSWKKINVYGQVDLYYISYPKQYIPNHNYILFYIHGQDELTTNKKYTQKIEIWANNLTKGKNILIAPNLFGNNINDQRSINEVILLVKKYKRIFPNTKIYLLTFSLGGIIGYKILSNKMLISQFDKIVIFAGTLPYTSLNIKTCKNIYSNLYKIRIYHGTLDKNVPIGLSTAKLKLFCNNSNYNISNSIYYLNTYDHWKLGYTNNLHKFLDF